MAEPEGRAGPEGASEAGALPEGFDNDAGGSSASSREGVPTFSPGRKSAGSLDLAVATDEPFLLIKMLVVAAQDTVDFSERSEEWKILLGYFHRAMLEVERAQEPPARPRA